MSILESARKAAGKEKIKEKENKKSVSILESARKAAGKETSKVNDRGKQNFNSASALDKLREKYPSKTTKPTTNSTVTEIDNGANDRNKRIGEIKTELADISREMGINAPATSYRKSPYYEKLLSRRDELSNELKTIEAQEKAEQAKAQNARTATPYTVKTDNAYLEAKSKIEGTTTIAGNLSEEERNNRINEIRSELHDLSRARSGLERASMYGNVGDLIKNNEERRATLLAELKVLERTGTFTGEEMLQFEIDDAKAEVQKWNDEISKYGSRPSVENASEWRAANSELYKANERVKKLERKKTLYKKITKFGDDVNTDTFVGQTKSNYRFAELSREADKAFSDYMYNPTEENKVIAFAYDALAREYMTNNAAALDDEGQILSWISKSAAGYMPQFFDQIGPQVAGGVVGGLLGSTIGLPDKGAAVGAGIATSLQSYDVMRGAVFRTLIAEGVDEEIAIGAANDEALLSSLIEGAGTTLSIMWLGGSKAIRAIGTAAKNSVAKGSANAATKFLANLAGDEVKSAAKLASMPFLKKGLRAAGGLALDTGGEFTEEYFQSAISDANFDRVVPYNAYNKIGQYGEGNIDLYNRPIYKNKDGTISTVDSVTFEIDGKFVVLPSIVADENGRAIRIKDEDDIVAHYVETGEYLGKFDTLAEANGYANMLHYAQQYHYTDEKKTPDDSLVVGTAKQLWGAVSGKNPEARKEYRKAGLEGVKINLMFGGSQTIVNNVITHYANADTVKAQNEIADTIIQDEETLDALIEEGKASGKGTVSEKIATEVEKAKENGKVTREQVKRLIASNEVYIENEEKASNEPDTLEKAAMDVVANRNKEQTAEKSSNLPVSDNKGVNIAPEDEKWYATTREAIQAVVADIESGMSAQDLKLKSFEALHEQERIRLNASGRQLTEAEIQQTEMLSKKHFYYDTASKNPQATLDDLKSFVSRNTTPEVKTAKSTSNEAETKAIEAAFEAGKANVPREKVNFVTSEQEEAYNAGRVEHIKNMPKETKNNVRTKKSDWAAHDVEWTVPNKKTPVAYSTKATSDLIETLADDNPTATISELKDIINYDPDAKKVLQQYIDAGHGEQIANEWFSYDRKRGYSNNAPTSSREENTITSTIEAELNPVIKLGTGFQGGKQRVLEFYKGNPSKAEAIDFLKKEYGIGSMSISLSDGTRGYTSHDGKGIKIDDYKGNVRVFSWSEVDNHIRSLIDNGEYFHNNSNTSARNDIDNAPKMEYTVSENSKMVLGDNGVKEENTNVRSEETIPDNRNAESTGSVGEKTPRGEGSNRERISEKIKEILRKSSLKRDDSGFSGRGSARIEQKETAEAFEERVSSDGYRYVIVDKTRLGYKQSQKSEWNENAKEAAEILDSLGLTVVVFEGELHSNKDGVSQISTEGATAGSGNNLTIFISSKLDIDGMETAYHEAFHALRRNDNFRHRMKMVDIISDGVDVDCEAFEKFVSCIAELYSYNVKEVSAQRFSVEIIEEFYSWYIGTIYANTNKHDVNMLEYVKQFSDVDNIKEQLDELFAKIKSDVSKSTSKKENTKDIHETKGQTDTKETTPKKRLKTTNKNAPFNSSETRLLCSRPKLVTGNLHGNTFITDGVLAIKVDDSTLDSINNEYKAKSGKEIAPSDALGRLVEGFVENNIVEEVSQTIPDDMVETNKNGKTKVTHRRTACIVGDMAFLFDTKYYEMLNKRSDTMKILSDGTLKRTVVAGFDTEGGLVGIVMPIRPPEGSYVEVDGKQIPYTFEIKKASSKKTTKEKNKESSKNAKPKVVETTTKLNDFGEKIGGARKDQWSSRGLVVDDLDGMNDRERDKNVKKDNVWKRPNYRALVEAGGDRGLLWAVNEIRKSLQQNVYYGYNATAETKTEKQKLFIETVRAIQSMAENAKTKADFEAMGEKWMIENGYLEDTGKTYGRYAYTQKFSQNPALSGSNYLNNIRYLAKNFDNLTNLADRNQFAVDTKSVVPKGFSIIGGEDSVGSKLVNGEWVKDTSYSVAKGRMIIKDGFATKEEALEWLKQGIAKKKGKTRFVPQQLQEVHRKGPDYRNSKSVGGQDYIDTFGFKGGEFGNWMSAKDRQVSLDYGYDALKDLADALSIEDTDISFGGNLNIAFGARGQGLSGAAAHYENGRRVINLTKMNGAGSLGHEWFHALDDFIGGYTNNYATDKYYSLPEKTKQAIRDLITTMQYKDATQEETDLAKQKQYEQAVRGITYTISNEFQWVEFVEKGTFKDSDARYYKRKPTIEDAKKYRELFDKLIETGEYKYVERLSDLRKEVNGRVIPKETRDSFSWRLVSLNSAKSAPIQKARKMTDFYSDSRKFGKLHSKDGDYWDSTVEMAARAFACYVADKTNKQNDYLTAHSDSAITLDADKDGKPVVVRAFPVGEERTAINDAFDNLIEALKADGFLHERAETEKPAETNYVLQEKSDKKKKVNNTDKFQETEDTDKLAMWTTKRVNNEVKPKSISEIVASIEHEFGINITTGHIRGKGVQGQYMPKNRGIRTKIANNLPVVSHELGHYFERTLGIKEQLTDEMTRELKAQLDAEFAESYTEEQLVREGVAEYVRRFLQNRETAAIDYPKFNDFFLKLLSSKDLAKLQQLADDINAYYALDGDTATSTIRLREEGGIDLRTPMEKLKDKGSSLYQAWYDSNNSIKRFDRATGSNAYMLASNAAYSDAVAGQIIVGDLTDTNGQYVASGLKTVLNGIDLNIKHKEYRLFGEYLTVKHGPERLREGMRVFADDRKNSTTWMENRQAQLEEQFPQFKETSERLYKFIKQFYKTWGVDTGLISKETLNSWGNRWEYYVPFNRIMEKGKGNIGAKRGFANQNSTIKKARGSGRDIQHPVDNLIDNIVKMVNAGTRNNVMRTITDNAEMLGADATFLEKVPMPMTATKMDMTGVKDTLTTWLEESDMDADSKDKASGVVNNLDDILIQYGRGKAFGNVVTVLKDGKPQAWKINDIGLLESLTSLSPKTMDGILNAYAVLSRFMTSNITGNNLVWSIFSNLPRDFATFFTYSKNKNVLKMAKGVGEAYLNKVKGDNASPYYKEFLAMGGGKTSAYTADSNLAKDMRKKLSGKIDLDPISMIGFASDMIESGPRFATYKLMREAGMSPQEAFYEAMDITVNFRRGGRISKELNKVVPFFNASMQGLDKFRRWITAEEYSGTQRKKAVAGRTISYIATSAVLAAIVYAINNGDEEKEKEYEQLSTYTKNSYWVFPVGDGKYFAIPKPREIGVLSSFFETCLEYGVGENDHAFDEFYAYASENFLPAIANDIAQVGSKGLVETGMNIIGSFGMFGVVGYLGANRDFLGRPIVASGLQNLEKKDQYTDRTSYIAYQIGQATGGSPEQIDYFFQQILGGWWKGQKALFPVGEKNRDLTLGVANTYIKDNQYSIDLTNWLYDRADTTARAKKSDPSDIQKSITAKWDSNMTDFYGTYYKKAKNNSNSTAARSTRQLVLDMIKEYQKGIDGNYKTSVQKAVEAVCESKNSTEYLPSVMSAEVTDGYGKKHTLSDVQYVEYQTDYLRLYWETVEDTMTSDMSTSKKAQILLSAKRVAREQATERTLKRIGAPSAEFATKYKGVENDDLTRYLAGVSEANSDNSVKKSEVVDVIKGMNIDNDDAWTLYLSKYSNHKAAYEAEEHGIDAKLFMTAVVDMGEIKPDYDKNGKPINGSRRAKVERYLNSVCGSYKEYLFLLGTEFDSIKDDHDYIQYFGK